jgi:hypothetical protein
MLKRNLSNLRNGSSAVLCCLLSLSLSGCITVPTQKDTKAEENRALSNFALAAEKFLKNGKPNYNESNLVETLEAAKSFHDAGMWSWSIDAFKKAEAMMPWTEDVVDTPDEVARVIGTTLINDLAAGYSGKIHEAAFVNYYQAINYLMMGDKGVGDNPTLVAMNRHRVRQSNVVSQLNSYVNSQNKGVAASKAQDKEGFGNKSLDENSFKFDRGTSFVANDLRVSEMRSASGDVLEAYYRISSRSSGGSGEASDILRQGMASAASTAGEDLMRLMRDRPYGDLNGHILVLFEDGFGPKLKEFRVDLPLVGLSRNVLYTGIALPEFVPGNPGLGRVRIGSEKVPTAVLTDLNRIAGLEFKSQYDGIVAKAVISTVLKTAAQAAVNQEIDKSDSGFGGLFMKLAVAATQAALTRADTRSWSTLPNTIQAAIVARPPDGLLRIYSEQDELLVQGEVPSSGKVLVVLKTIGTAPPAMYVSQPF